ncbi:MAG: hypothetical protein ACREQK_11860, partial [Candidatus Binatia bacterium]
MCPGERAIFTGFFSNVKEKASGAEFFAQARAFMSPPVSDINPQVTNDEDRAEMPPASAPKPRHKFVLFRPSLANSSE